MKDRGIIFQPELYSVNCPNLQDNTSALDLAAWISVCELHCLDQLPHWAYLGITGSPSPASQFVLWNILLLKRFLRANTLLPCVENAIDLLFNIAITFNCPGILIQWKPSNLTKRWLWHLNWVLHPLPSIQITLPLSRHLKGSWKCPSMQKQFLISEKKSY